MVCCSARVLGIVSLTGLLGTVIFRWGIVDPLVHDEIAKKLILEPGSQLWDFWTDIPIPIYMRFFFFNVTNPDEITRGAKPIVKEIGPYVYEEKRKKIIVSSNDQTIKFRPRTVYTFRPDLSVNTDDDNITMVNVPFVGIAKMAWKYSQSPLVLSTLDDTLTEKGERLFHTHSVREYLFDGVSIQNYMDLLSLAGTLGIDTNSFEIPKQLLDGDFGFFEDKNATANDIWVVKTGKDNLNDFARTISWNGKASLGMWGDEKCDKIDGSDGTLFPPFATTSSVLKGFSPDFCRTVDLVYKRPSQTIGIPTLRFGYTDSFFGSLTDFPENECYCKESREHCQKGGVISLGPCLGGAPVFASQPHFAGAHKDYIDAIEGLTPHGDYASYVDLEPHLGLPIRGNLRIQLNMEIQPYTSMESFANVPNLMLPILWAEESATVTDELASPLKMLLHGIQFMDFMAGAMIICFALCIAVAIILEGRENKWHLKLSGK